MNSFFKWRWWILGLVIVGLIGGLLWWLYWYRAEWAGFYTPPNSPYENWKRLWDWLDLLIVPLVLGMVLAIGGVLLNRAQHQREQKIADERREQERDLAEKVREQEREIAKEREEERALQSYLDAMTALLLKENLRGSKEGSEVRSVARARTLTVLRGLNKVRKASVLRFLYESKLIDTENSVIDLYKADLSGTELSRTDLGPVNLSQTNLNGANLSGTYLDRANLSWADLSEANLSYVHLSKAFLSGSNLSQADLNQARLSGTDLSRTNLNEANLSRADLNQANLSRAFLIEANLNLANLSQADVSGTDLAGADLSGANLNLADLSETDLAGANLTNAKYNTEAFKDKFGTTYQPTQWPDDLDPAAAGAIDASKNAD